MMQKPSTARALRATKRAICCTNTANGTVAEFFISFFPFCYFTWNTSEKKKIFLGLVSCQLSNAQDDIIGRTEKIIKLRRAQSGRNIKICAKNFHCEGKQFFCECTRQWFAYICTEWLLTKKAENSIGFETANLWWKSVWKSLSSLKIDEKALLTTSEVERHGGTCLLICRLAVDSLPLWCIDERKGKQTAKALTAVGRVRISVTADSLW